ncbi:hypothetical protein MMC15_004523 [Xylographa vitiligo]|nr:hypothetical protein [Xylographa vitiligo]
MVNYKRLAANDINEAEKLFRACQTDGFFYLDLYDPDDQIVLNSVDDVYALARSLFTLDDAEKLIYDVDKLGEMKLNGYIILTAPILLVNSPRGRNIGGLNSKRDGFESYAIAQNSILFPSQLHSLHPLLLQTSLPLLTTLTDNFQAILTTLLTSLSTSLLLPSSATLQSFHRPLHPSSSILRLLHYHPLPAAERGPPQTPHTDLGTLTLLFSQLPGLQVLRPGPAAEWAYVLPQPNCAIVNVGDALALLTGRAMARRFSVAYLQRAEDQTKLVPVQSPLMEERTRKEKGVVESKSEEDGVTSGEWLRKKFSVLRGEKVDEGVLTGSKQTLVA